MPKLPDAEVILHGLITALVEKTDFETKAVTGYRATVITSGGGAAVVNFDNATPLPFAPIMSQVIWRVISSPWEMNDGGRRSSGMSSKFIGEADQAHLMGLLTVLEENAARFPDKATASK